MRNKLFESVVAIFIVFVITKPSPKLLVIPPVSQRDFQRWRAFASKWGEKPEEYLPGDLNRDRIVDFKDLTILANNWLRIDLEFIARKWLE